MKFEETNIENDLDFDLADGLEPERLVLPSTLVIDNAETEKILKYCIIAALLLHLLLFIIVTRVGLLQPSHSLLRPGEKVTQDPFGRTPGIVERQRATTPTGCGNFR